MSLVKAEDKLTDIRAYAMGLGPNQVIGKITHTRWQKSISQPRMGTSVSGFSAASL
jgi:hypothetical protein